MVSMYPLTIGALVAVLLALPVLAQTEGDEQTPVVAVQIEDSGDEPVQPTLEELQWVARPIVVFADTPNDPRFLQQIRMLEERSDDLAARDAVILVDTDPAALGPLRKALRPRGFGLVLIDKDGSVVRRHPAPTTSRELINQIDRLPSRRQEIGSSRQ
jgi:hypothetical protein